MEQTPGTDEAALPALLRRFIAAQTGDPESAIDVDHVARVGDGKSKENWIFDASWPGASPTRQQLIARREPATELLDTDPRAEFSLLRALEPADLPTPTARWLDPDGSLLGRPTIVMDRLPGECDYFLLNNPARPLATRTRLGEELIGLVARVHRLDVDALGMPAPAITPSLHALDYWLTTYRRHAVEPMPEIVVVAGWLRERAPETQVLALVHGDVKPGNVLVDADRISGLLDWELAHLGDPLEDLGWITQPLRRREQQIAGAFDQNDIIACYVRQTGLEVPAAGLLWWQVLACFKACIIQLTGIRRFVDGASETLFSAPVLPLRTMFQLIQNEEAACGRHPLNN